MKKTLCVIILFCFVITTGCAEMSKSQKATAQGGLAGGAVGALIAKLSGGDEKDIARAAFIGAAIGALVAYNLASRLEEERKSLEGKENDLDARIAYARSVNTQTKKYNEDLTADIDKIEESVQKGMAKKADLTRMQNKLNEDIASVNTTLKELKEYRVTLISKNHPKAKVDELDAQIQELQAHLESIENNALKFAQLKKRIKV
jgi:peptidoglycan hydrolase CwlO-like protein